MESRGKINPEQVHAYAVRHGARQTEECLRRLGVLQQFYNAYHLPLGQELLSTVNAELIRLADRILCSPDATDDDKAMYRAYATIAQSWGKRVADYDALMKDISSSG